MTIVKQASFTGGELSPELHARTDIAKYVTGAKTLRNFYVSRTGGAFNRPGTEYVGEIKDSNTTVRLIPFIFNNEQTYVLEFGPGYIRFIRNGAYILDGAVPYEVATPYVEADIPYLRYTQNADIIFIAHQNYYPSGLRRYGDTNWVLSDISFGTTIQTPTNVAVSGTAGTVTYWTVTAVAIDTYEESLAPTSAGANSEPSSGSPRTITWTGVEDAYKYNIYRSVNGVFGYIGSATGSSFIDNGITPDLDLVPPEEMSIIGRLDVNFTKIVDPDDLPAGNGLCSAYSPNGEYLAVGHETTPFITIYQVTNGVYTKITDPADLPAEKVNSLDWSADSSYLAVAHNDSPYLTVYSRSGSTFTKLTNPTYLPMGNGVSVKFDTVATNLIFIAIDVSPWIQPYSISGSAVVSATNGKSANASAWNASTNRVTISFGINVPAFYENTPCQLTTTGTLPTGLSTGTTYWIYHPAAAPGGEYSFATTYNNAVAESAINFTDSGSGTHAITIINSFPEFTPNAAVRSLETTSYDDGGYDVRLIVGHDTSPYVAGYRYRTLLGANPWTLDTTLFGFTPAGPVYGISSNGSYIALAHTNTPFVSVTKSPYSAKLANPDVLPDGHGKSVAFSDNGQYLAVGHATSKYVSLYQMVGDVLDKIPDPADEPTGTVNGVTFYPDSTGMAAAHATTPFVSIYDIAGLCPGIVGFYQQRLLLGQTRENPEVTYGSKSGLYRNFTTRFPSSDSDALVFAIAGSTVNTIKHFIELQQLVILTSGGEWLVAGNIDGVLSPDSINAKQQSYYGSTDVPPIHVGDIILFIQNRETKIRSAGFFGGSSYLTGQDLTAYSTHLFDGYTLRDWTYQYVPNSIIWVVRSDGTLLGLTLNMEHEMLAWHRHDFNNGIVENVCCVPETGQDALYLVIRREIDGSTVRYVERMATQYVTDPDEFVYMDSSLEYDGWNTSTIVMALTGGTDWTHDEDLTLTSSAAYFSVGEVGNEIHMIASDGSILRLEITAYTSDVSVTVRANHTVPADLRETPVLTWARAVDEVTGMDHLEGEDVVVMGDGYVVANPNNPDYDNATVSSGTVTLSQCYAVIRVGLPIVCDIETLDIDFANTETMADKKKNITKVSLNVHASRSLWAGNKPPEDDDTDMLEDLTELKIRDWTGADEVPGLVSDVVDIIIKGNWNGDGHIFIRHIDPLPLRILSIMPTGQIPTRG